MLSGEQISKQTLSKLLIEKYQILAGMGDATQANFVARQTQKEELPFFVFNGRNHADFNENWKTFIEFYDCRQVFEPDYEALAADADAGVLSFTIDILQVLGCFFGSVSVLLSRKS